MSLAFAKFAEGTLWLAAWLVFCLSGFATALADTAVKVTTQRYDNARTGANFSETLLNISNVSPGRFGKLFTRAVDDDVYAQPLYLPAVSLPNMVLARTALPAGLQRLVNAALVALRMERVVNVLYVATVNNSVYAFDANDPAAAAPIWHVNLTGDEGGARPVKNFDVGERCGNYPDFRGNIGIVGTPAIDADNHTLYVVARTNENGQFVQRLHALDVRTGAERTHSPVVIEARVEGTGVGSSNGVLTFDPQIQNQRGALLLSNGVVYITWGSHCDSGPYHGWIMGYDATTLAQVFAKATTPDGQGGGIWQSNTGPSADASGNIYVAIGNGTVTAPKGGKDYGNAVLKLNRTGEVLSWFIPYNFETLNSNDWDFGTTGVLLVPKTNLLATGSKEGKLYLLDRDDLGGFRPDSDSQIVESLRTGPGWLLGTPTYWNVSGGPRLYVWCSGSSAQSFRLSSPPLAERSKEIQNGVLQSAAESSDPASSHAVLTEDSRTKILAQDIPGGMLSISADGSKAGSGILWASLGIGSTYLRATVPGVLRAFDATDLSHELWNSQQNPRDDFGNLAKFNTPVVANGRVYLATFSHQIAVYGLRNPNNAPPTVSASSDLPAANTATLFGHVEDDGLPKSPGAPTTNWIQVTGPAPSIIESSHSLDTKVKFPAPGNYVFRLTASDGELSSEADVSVDVRDLASGLVGLWTFQEGSGNNVRDSSGTGNHGRYFPANAPAEKRGTGEFSGSVLTEANPIRIPSSESLNQLRQQITVVARVYPRKLPASEFVAVVQRQWRQEIHPDLFFLGYGPRDGALRYKWHLGLVGGEADLFGLPPSQSTPQVGQWVQLAGTYDAFAGKASLYVDGELIGTQNVSGEIRLDSESLERPLVIGGEINGTDIEQITNEFNGYVDEVRIYDRTLSDQEIRTLALASSATVTRSKGLIDTGYLPIEGGPGGEPFAEDCSDNYAVGFYFRSGGWVDAIGLKCSRLDPQLERFERPPYDKPFHGGLGGTFGVEGTCPSNTYLSGVTQGYTISEGENQFLNFLEMTCKNITDDSSVHLCLETGHGCWAGTSPTADVALSKPIEQHCPAGKAVAGIRGRSGQFVDALGLMCKPILRGLSGGHLLDFVFN